MRNDPRQEWDRLPAYLEQCATWYPGKPLDNFQRSRLALIPLVEHLRERPFFRRLAPWQHHGQLDLQVAPGGYHRHLTTMDLLGPEGAVRVSPYLPYREHTPPEEHHFTRIGDAADFLEEILSTLFADDPLFWPLTIDFETPPEAFQKPSTAYMVARWNGQPVAHGAVNYVATHWNEKGYANRGYREVLRLEVVPEFRGRGIGRRLLQHLEHIGHWNDYWRVYYVQTAPLAPEIVTFFEKCGYEPCSAFSHARSPL